MQLKSAPPTPWGSTFPQHPLRISKTSPRRKPHKSDPPTPETNPFSLPSFAFFSGSSRPLKITCRQIVCRFAEVFTPQLRGRLRYLVGLPPTSLANPHMRYGNCLRWGAETISKTFKLPIPLVTQEAANPLGRHDLSDTYDDCSFPGSLLVVIRRKLR